MNPSIKSIKQLIIRNNKFLITSHTEIEGDAIGSEIALAKLLKAKRKDVIIVNASKLPDAYNFIPGSQSVQQVGKRGPDYDVAIILDCSAFNRIGKVKKNIAMDKPILNIDHHATNDKFGSINWVNPKASSTAEMIYKLFQEFKVGIDKSVAIALYTGILFDTGSFRHANTTSSTHAIVAKLLKKKLAVSKIYQNIFGSIPIKEARFLIKILSNLKTNSSKKILWISLSYKQAFKKMSSGMSDNIFAFLCCIKGIEVAVIFREMQKRNFTRVNFRSMGSLDVGSLASNFGGGGHRGASGCMVKLRLKQAEHLILNQLNKRLK